MSSKTQNPVPNVTQSSKTQVGNYYEDLASDFLLEQGLKLVTRNFRAHRLGEIDLICEQSDGVQAQVLVFVEVRRRAGGQFGGAACSITKAKQKKLRRAAAAFLKQHGHFAEHLCRFDAVLFDAQQKPEWIKGAF